MDELKKISEVALNVTMKIRRDPRPLHICISRKRGDNGSIKTPSLSAKVVAKSSFVLSLTAVYKKGLR